MEPYAPLALASEFCPGGTLLTKVQQCVGVADAATALGYMAQVWCTLHWLWFRL